MTFRAIRILLVALILAAGAGSAAARNRTVEMGCIEFPPVFFTNSQGKAEGYLIDLAEMVMAKAGYGLNARSFPTKRMAKELVDGGIDLWIGLSTLPQFKDTTLIGASEVARISLRAYTVGGKTPITKKEDLIGKSVLIIRGFSYGGWITFIKDPANQVRYMEIDSHDAGFRMLKAGRADYFLDYRSPAENALKSLTVPDLAFNEISAFGAYFVVSKKAPDAEKLLADMEAAYAELVKEGKWTPPE